MAGGLKKQPLDKCKELHSFIHSLTLGQHLGVRQQLPPKRLKMYDTYRSSEEHNPELIRAAFPDDTRFNLSSTKRVLLDQITRYVYLHVPHDGARDLELLIGEGKALKLAGQNNLALDKVDTAIKLAIEMEAVEDLLKAVRLRRSIKEALREKIVDKLDYGELEEVALASIAERHAIEVVFSAANAQRSRPVTEQYHAMAGLEDCLNAIPFPKMIRNQVKYRGIRFFISRVRLDSETSLREAEAITSTLDGHPGIMQDLDIRDEYFAKMNFIISERSDRKELKEAEERLNKLKALSVRWSGGVDGNLTQYARFLFAELSLKMAQNEWGAVRTLVKKLNKEVIEEDVLKGVATRPAILRLGAFAAFLIQDFRSTRRFIMNLKRDTADYATKTTLLTWAGTMQLLSYVEERDPYLKTALKDVAAWFKQVGCDSPLEKALLAFFKEVSEDPDISFSASSLDRLHDALARLFEMPEYGKYKALLKIIEWIEAKRNGIDFKSLIF